jgi:hypothetical protein
MKRTLAQKKAFVLVENETPRASIRGKRVKLSMRIQAADAKLPKG